MPYEGWRSEELDEPSREAFYKAALELRERAESDSRRTNWWVVGFGAVGWIVGLIGMAAGLVAYVKTPVPEPPGYITIDTSLGKIDPPVAAKDAPKLFNEAVREAAMRDFIVACESYVPQTWNKIDYHACMIQASPDEQKRRAADIGQNGPHYPPTVFGPAGWAMPTDFLSFVKLGEVGTAPNQTFSYQVRYGRTEVTNGRESRPRYTAMITLQFHPELRISPSDRLINPSGLQVVSFSTTKD